MMNKQYVIQWKSRVNGRAGKGTKLFSREEAEKLATELNQEYPDIEHSALGADLEGGQPVQAAGENLEEEAVEDTAKPEPTIPPVLSLQE